MVYTVITRFTGRRW